MSHRIREQFYETHINMYPPNTQAAYHAQQPQPQPQQIKHTTPYPVEDTQEVINPVPFQYKATTPTTSTNSSTPKAIQTPVDASFMDTNSRYYSTFALNSSNEQLSPPQRPAMNSQGSAGSLAETFESAHSSVDIQPPPPPYEESEAQQHILKEKVYRTEEDLVETQTQAGTQEAGTDKHAISKSTTDSPSSTRSSTKSRPLSEYSDDALKFYEVYKSTIADSPNFTPLVQMKWCETLLLYAFNEQFTCNYNINAEKLKRQLTTEEMLKNQKIILEHALKVLTKLMTLKYSPALYFMGTLYSHQPYLDIKNKGIVSRNDTKALDYYTKAAKLKHPNACYRSGISYEYQRGTDPSLTKEMCLQKAMYYYERGADKCHDVSCMYKLGMFYLQGIATPHDPKNAIEWFLRASNEDPQYKIKKEDISPQALYELGKIYEFDSLSNELRELLQRSGITRSSEKALYYYHRCATKCSYPLAQWRLGHCYEFGELSLPIIASKSIAWYAKAARAKPKGNPMAMMALSGWYLTGATGVLQPNDQEAFSWALKSCQSTEGKFARAEYALAFFYERGIGCTKDPSKALEHYKCAAQMGHPKAQDRYRELNSL